MARVKSRVKRRVKIKRPRAKEAQGGNFFEGLLRLAIPAALFLGAGCVILVFMLLQSGWFTRQIDNSTQAFLFVTKRAGFAVKEIVIEGHEQSDRNVIEHALDVMKGTPILAFDPKDALERLSTISWVKSGSVERRLPSTIYVRVNERTPIALWQNKGKFYLIDQEGHVVREAEANEHTNLPQVVGDGAQSEAADLLAQLAQQPVVFNLVKAAVRVGNRRWDLHMPNEVVVKLPEEGVDSTLQRLAKLITEQHILERDIVSLDMRLPDRMAVETTQPVNPPKTTAKTPPKI
jgi:cell division protein FtsQ